MVIWNCLFGKVVVFVVVGVYLCESVEVVLVVSLVMIFVFLDN